MANIKIVEMTELNNAEIAKKRDFTRRALAQGLNINATEEEIVKAENGPQRVILSPQAILEQRAVTVGLESNSSLDVIEAAEQREALVQRAIAVGLKPKATIAAVQKAEASKFGFNPFVDPLELQNRAILKGLKITATEAEVIRAEGGEPNDRPYPSDLVRRARAANVADNSTEEEVVKAEAIKAELLNK